MLYPSLGIALMALLWDLATRLGAVPAYLVPSPGAVVETMWTQRELLARHGWVTTVETLLGFGVSAVIGILLALVITFSKPVARTLYPLLIASQAVPKIAIAPLFVVWLGFGLTPKVLIAFLVAFFPVVIDTTIGLRAVPDEMIKLAQSMGAKPWRTFWKIRLPYALPNIFGGLKVAMTLAVVGAIVGEFVGADSGLGYLIPVSGHNLQVPLLFAAIVSLVVLSLALYFAIEVLEVLVTPGRRVSRRHH